MSRDVHEIPLNRLPIVSVWEKHVVVSVAHPYLSSQAYVCPRTQLLAHTCKCVYVYLSETWRNFSIADTRRRVLREFKIPLTASRHSDIRYKSHIRVAVCEPYTDIHMHVYLRKRFHPCRFDAELISLPRYYSSAIRSINGSWQILMEELWNIGRGYSD